jgi:ectoine hydroxylase-related dioxygenase (phytanoyl-CoA dioxygenase family)
MIVAELDAFDVLGDSAPWMPLVKAILGDDVKRLSSSCILSLPGSDAQPWHSDGEHVEPTMHLPPHCLNVFIPLVNMTKDFGPTQFVPGSHIHYGTNATPVGPTLPAGRPLLFDHRVKHRGVPNTTKLPRPLL